MSCLYNGSMDTQSIKADNTQPPPPVIETLLGYCQTIAETAREQVLDSAPLSSKRFPPYPAPASFKTLLVSLKTCCESLGARSISPTWLSTLKTEHPFLRKKSLSPLLTLGLPDQSDIPLTQYTFLPPEQTKNGEVKFDPALLEKAIYNFTSGLHTYLQARDHKLLLEDWCYLSINLSYITLGLTNYFFYLESRLIGIRFSDEKKLTLFQQFLLLLDTLFSDDVLKLLFTNALPETHKKALKMAKSTLFKLIKESKKIQIVELNKIIFRYPVSNITFSEADCQHLVDAAYHASNKKNASLLEKKQFFIASLQKKVKSEIVNYFNQIEFTDYKDVFAEFSFSHYLQSITRDIYYYPIKRIIDSFIIPTPRRNDMPAEPTHLPNDASEQQRPIVTADVSPTSAHEEATSHETSPPSIAANDSADDTEQHSTGSQAPNDSVETSAEAPVDISEETNLETLEKLKTGVEAAIKALSSEATGSAESSLSSATSLSSESSGSSRPPSVKGPSLVADQIRQGIIISIKNSIKTLKEHFKNQGSFAENLQQSLQLKLFAKRKLNNLVIVDLPILKNDLKTRLTQAQLKIESQLRKIEKQRSEQQLAQLQKNLEAARLEVFTKSLIVTRERSKLKAQSRAHLETYKALGAYQQFALPNLKAIKRMLKYDYTYRNGIGSRLKRGLFAFLALFTQYGKRRYENCLNKLNESKAITDYMKIPLNLNVIKLQSHIENRYTQFFKPQSQSHAETKLNKVGRLLEQNGLLIIRK